MFTKGYVLVLHGLNSTPEDMSSLIGELEKAGYSVSAPALPGVGGGIRLKGLKASDFVDAAFKEWNRLPSGKCKAIVGLSLGGMLGAMIASQNKDVDALVMLSPSTNPPRGIAGRLLPYLHWMKPWYSPLRESDFSNPELLRRLEKRYKGIDLRSEEGRAKVLEESKIPTAALVEVIKLQKEMLRALPKTVSPVLVMFGGKDDLVSVDDERKVCKALSERKGVREVIWKQNCSYRGETVRSAWAIWFRESSHCLPCGPERDAVAENIVNFLEVVSEQ
jgi:esterase/lipase